MLNVRMVDNLEFWYTIFEVRGQNMCSTPGFHAYMGEPVLLLCYYRDKIDDDKRKLDTNRFVSEIQKIWKDLLLLDSPNVHPQF